MLLENNPPIIYSPTTLSELLTTYKKNPNALIFAGGTWILSRQTGKIVNLGRAVINIFNINELQKITRTERYIDFGACTTLDSILKINTKVIPPILTMAIEAVATPQIRNRATIGGHLAVKTNRMSLFPVLAILDAKIELRKVGKSRWVDVKRFATNENHLNIESDEIITRIRIPIDDYAFQTFKDINTPLSNEEDYISASALAKISKGNIYDAKIIIMFSHYFHFRPIQTENLINGKTIPLEPKAVTQIQNSFLKEYANLGKESSTILKERITRIFNWLLDELSNFHKK